MHFTLITRLFGLVSSFYMSLLHYLHRKVHKISSRMKYLMKAGHISSTYDCSGPTLTYERYRPIYGDILLPYPFENCTLSLRYRNQ